MPGEVLPLPGVHGAAGDAGLGVLLLGIHAVPHIPAAVSPSSRMAGLIQTSISLRR
jgi:hypothetical protein